MTNEAPQSAFLTVAQLISDLQQLPQDAEICCAMNGIGMTVPIIELMKVKAEENKDIVVLVISAMATVAALRHAQEQEKVNQGTPTN